jgi:hypothetical protein
VKHVSVIACISGTGESLTSYIVRSQNSSRVQEYLNKRGVRFSSDLNLKSDANLIRTVFLPYLVSVRDLAAFAEEVAVLSTDNCSADFER